MAFLNCQKYPPSLLYALMTLGPGLLVLAGLDATEGAIATHGRRAGAVRRALVTLGRVPLFYYVLQWPVIHVMASLVNTLAGQPVHLVLRPFDGPLRVGYSLPFVYLMWALVVAILYVPCRWYAGLKLRRKDWTWLSYLVDRSVEDLSMEPRRRFRLMDLGLAGQVVAVFGAARGIGEAIARAFMAESANVAAIDRDAAVMDVAEQLPPAPPAGRAALPDHDDHLALGLVADVTDLAAVRRAAESVHRYFGRCDHVVFAVGWARASSGSRSGTSSRPTGSRCCG